MATERFERTAEPHKPRTVGGAAESCVAADALLENRLVNAQCAMGLRRRFSRRQSRNTVVAYVGTAAIIRPRGEVWGLYAEESADCGFKSRWLQFSSKVKVYGHLS